MRPVRLLTVALAAVLAVSLPVGAGAATTAPACTTSPAPRPVVAAPAPLADAGGMSLSVEETRIRWTRWSTRVVHGDRAVLEGQVVTGDGAVARAQLDLLERPAGATEWTLLGTAETDSETGVFSFGCLRPSVTTEYRAVYHGTVYFGASQAQRKVGVARRVHDSLERTGAERFVLSGSVGPRYVGRRVLLQRRSCGDCGWRTVRRADTTSRSRWRFAIDSSSFTRRQWFRAVVPADGRYVRSVGDHVWRIG